MRIPLGLDRQDLGRQTTDTSKTNARYTTTTMSNISSRRIGLPDDDWPQADSAVAADAYARSDRFLIRLSLMQEPHP